MAKHALAWSLLIASALFLMCPSHALGESQTRKEALPGETIGNSHNAAIGSTKFEDEELTVAPVSAPPSSPKVLPLSGFNTASSLRSAPSSPPSPPPPPADDDDDVEVNESGDDDDDSSDCDDSCAAPVIPSTSPPTQTPSPPLSPPATSSPNPQPPPPPLARSSNQPVAPVPPVSSTPSEAQDDGYTSPDDPQAHGRGHNTSSTVCGGSGGGAGSSSSSASAGSGEPTATAVCTGDTTAGAAASHSNDGSGSDAVVHRGGSHSRRSSRRQSANRFFLKMKHE